ncbi:hypothetical protein R8789_02785 [Streptomyces malaysiensis]|nr:hypothetical protein R8789_02785 [Streptomyces malaysiensis]
MELSLVGDRRVVGEHRIRAPGGDRLIDVGLLRHDHRLDRRFARRLALVLKAVHVALGLGRAGLCGDGASAQVERFLDPLGVPGLDQCGSASLEVGDQVQHFRALAGDRPGRPTGVEAMCLQAREHPVEGHLDPLETKARLGRDGRGEVGADTDDLP